MQEETHKCCRKSDLRYARLISAHLASTEMSATLATDARVMLDSGANRLGLPASRTVLDAPELSQSPLKQS